MPWSTYPSFPGTLPITSACNQYIYSQDLYDKDSSNGWQVYGRAYVWKDYADQLYVTVSLNATVDAAGGQYLYATPGVPNVATPTYPMTGQLYLWNSLNLSLPTAYVNNVATDSMSGLATRWSCFTYQVHRGGRGGGRWRGGGMERVSVEAVCTNILPYTYNHHQKAFRNKSHTSYGHRPGLKRNKSKGKILTII